MNYPASLPARHLLLALCALLPLGACSATDAGPPPAVDGHLPDPRPVGQTLVYECSGAEFIARVGPGEMAVWLDDRYVILSRRFEGPGIRYEEGELMFTLVDGDATLFDGGQVFGDCVNNPGRAPWEDARRRGVDFRAIGEEPGWSLEVRAGQQLLFTADYGMRRVLVSPLEESASADGVIYRGSSGGTAVRVEIAGTGCIDPMSGERFPATVAVALGQERFTGCGRALDHPWQ